jgi:cytochrome P450/NADPH-cytochrome P450 reductase
MFDVLVNAFDLKNMISLHAGHIFKLSLGGEDKLFTSTRELMNEVCDEKRFSKMISGALAQI